MLRISSDLKVKKVLTRLSKKSNVSEFYGDALWLKVILGSVIPSGIVMLTKQAGGVGTFKASIV